MNTIIKKSLVVTLCFSVGYSMEQPIDVKSLLHFPQDLRKALDEEDDILGLYYNDFYDYEELNLRCTNNCTILNEYFAHNDCCATLFKLHAGPFLECVQTPLHRVASYNQPVLLVSMLEHIEQKHPDEFISRINATDGNGRTPLFNACLGCPNNIKNLLHYGATLEWKDKHGHTPLNFFLWYNLQKESQEQILDKAIETKDNFYTWAYKRMKILVQAGATFDDSVVIQILNDHKKEWLHICFWCLDQDKLIKTENREVQKLLSALHK